MVEENINWELMGPVYKQEAETTRKQLAEAQKDKSVLINLLLQAKPELQRWVEVHFHD